jgi:hypothetical protein
MTTKRKPTLKQVFNAWVKHQKKINEEHEAKRFLRALATEVGCYCTELIEHQGSIYRITVTDNRWGGECDVKKVAKTSELPIKK